MFLHGFTTPWGVTGLFVLLLALSPVPGEAQRGDLFQGPEREQVREEVERLAEIQARHEEALFSIPGVHGIGIAADRATKELRFLILIDHDDVAFQIPTEIEGVPVVIEISEPPVLLGGGSSCSACSPCHADQQSLPVQMGNSTSGEFGCNLPLPQGGTNLCDPELEFYDVPCTLGFKVCSYGSHYYVTAAHCSPDSSGCVGGAPIGSDTFHRELEGPACTPNGRLLGSYLPPGQSWPAGPGRRKLDPG